MDIKVTRHTSTDLTVINDKIATILKEPADVTSHARINTLNMTTIELSRFAERGGLGSCVAKVDVLAQSSDDLMYLSGEPIVVLRHIEDNIYLGYCEGVIGRFNAETVHFVELDPHVLDSLDTELSDSVRQSRNYTDAEGSQARASSDLSRMAIDTDRLRGSLHSTSSISERYPSSILDRSMIASPRMSAESFTLPLATPTAISHEPMSTQSDTHHFDTSAFNDSYTDESDDDATDADYMLRVQSPTLRTPTTPVTAKSDMSGRYHSSWPRRTFIPYDTEDDEDDYTNTSHEDDHDQDSTGSSRNSSHISSRSSGIRNVDENGFLIDPGKTKIEPQPSSSRIDMSPKSMKAYRERESKWLSIVSRFDVTTVRKDAKLKKLVRSGIPTSVRARVWQFLAGAHDYRRPGVFETLMNQPSRPIYDVIEKDIARCYPDHSLFNDDNGQGQKDLEIILKAYSQYNTDLAYCQGMGRLAGCMLMHMPAEDAFWLMVATIDRYLNGYYTPTLPQLRIDANIIGQLIKEHQPKLAQHLESNDIQPIMYIAPWFLTAFTMTLPWNTVLRVWDVFYFEGIKVFYRVSLAILEICKDHLLQACPTNAELLDFLLHIPHDYLEADTLLDTAFRIKMSKTNLKRYAKKASTMGDAAGLSVEHSIKNLMVGSPSSSTSNIRSLGRAKKKHPNPISATITTSSSTTTTSNASANGFATINIPPVTTS